jgi:hypothetical protein
VKALDKRETVTKEPVVESDNHARLAGEVNRNRSIGQGPRFTIDSPTALIDVVSDRIVPYDAQKTLGLLCAEEEQGRLFLDLKMIHRNEYLPSRNLLYK